ncbi:MAG TPA: NAD-glutamate dehydrogenase [Nocardioidaceae bacterium]|nr:NAD-glutamate dehydrogenase [Nocardioidaceae bacterium]
MCAAMHGRLEEAKDQLLAEAAELAHRQRSATLLDAEHIRRLLLLYYRHVAPEDLVERTPSDVYGAAVSHYTLAQHRPQGTAAVHVFTPTVEENEWTAGGHTVVEIVVDDMPFLVDSVTIALTGREHPLHLVIHPQMLVRREITGSLQELSDQPHRVASEEPGLARESWMHLEIDRVGTQAELDAIEEAIRGTLRDVREVVEDWQKMHDQARAVVADLRSAPPPLPEAEIQRAAELLEWLADDHFTFLGYREYRLESVGDDDFLRAVPGSGLGILRSDQDMSSSVGKLPPAVRARAREPKLLVITKANSRATVHRPAYLDYVGFKTFDAAGDVVGERRFLGLFSSAAYTESVTRIPLLRDRVAEVLNRSGFSELSHSGKTLMDILENYPRDELFQPSVEELAPIAEAVLHLRERRQLRLFSRREVYGRYLSCLVYLPRDRYTTTVREKIEEILRTTLGAATVDYTARVSESVLARLHFVCRAAPGGTLKEFDEAALEQKLAEAARSWTDDFTVALREQFGEQEGSQLARGYRGAFPEAYKEDFPAQVAAADVRRLEAVPEGGIELSLYTPFGAAEDEARFKVFRRVRPLSLSSVLPILSALGVEVVDERPYELEQDEQPSWIYDFGLRHRHPMPEGTRTLFQDAFMAVWGGRAESDGFSALVVEAQLPWRKVAILRAYAKYFRQGGSTFSQDYLESTLVTNVGITQLLVELFEARFDPAVGGPAERQPLIEKTASRIAEALDGVASLDQDRILRSYLAVIQATVRTNFYQRDAAGAPKPYLSFKLEPTAIPDLPEPRPMFEIFVYSPRVEGVHLRFGPVARGGLRWSDRREDFRTEVLGLVKAQMVKNAVIVPVGSKGGFYCKNLPDPVADRDAWLKEGIACYQTFVCGLLDLTDNLVDDRTVPPPDVVRHDPDDPYLVVAADKGTATFSDIANGVAKSYGYWLGDAFASGGSVGYDHKDMGITARGAWESVRRHFRERGIDCQTEDFTCTGIGDMSGDVFGNGMLLSRHIRLLAAFDHRHIFVDPDPDAESSYEERRRLFDLPRSSWADYDQGKISAGGGVFPRTLKSIPVCPEMAQALSIDPEVTKLTPAALMRAILLAPVDLLFNGGIGTYVKAESETNADAGDKANDAVRVNGSELRCKAVGEGGNLGFTQRGRIEYAENGGRLNTDFIDNSAGVDTSDHEVNIKILLDKVTASGDMTQKQRAGLLHSMTDEVAALVLRDNYEQNNALASSAAVARPLLHVHQSWVRRLERAGLLDRNIEFLPPDKEFAARKAAGASLTQPELCVLLAYTKIALEKELAEGDLPEDPFLLEDLYGYFPVEVRDAYRKQIESHPLRRQIIVTQVVNSLVNFAGITFFHRLSLETGASAEDLARAHHVCRQVYGVNEVIDQINALDNLVPAKVQTDMRLTVRTLIERATRWLVNNRRAPLDSEATVEHFGDYIRRVVQALPEVLAGVEWEDFAARRDALTKSGVPEELAKMVAALPPAYAVLEVVEIAKRHGIDPLEVVRVHAVLGERLGIPLLLARIVALPRDDRWQTMARATLRDDMHAVHAALTDQVLQSTSPDAGPADRVAAWEAADEALIGRAVATLGEIAGDDDADLARLSVGLRVVRGMLATA